MLYRRLGSRVREEVSALGYGCMRFPTQPDGGRIDREATFELLRHAVENGINYFDTAWGYHGGESEVVVGEFFSRGYRDTVFLATKMPMWEVHTAEDLDTLFSQQLERLRTDTVDFYLLHALDSSSWKLAGEVDALGWAERRRAEGRIRYVGFSFHDDYQTFVEIVDGFEWDFCQIQYNYMNETHQAGTAGLAHAARKGIGVIVMEPLLGGALAAPPPEVAEVFARSRPSRQPVEHAFRWLWNKPDVGVVLSGMSTFDQLDEDLQIAGRSPAGCLTDPEPDLFRRARDIYESIRPVPCTSCGYCLPCPNGVSIPRNFEILNDFHMFGNEGQARWGYRNTLKEDERASACVECGDCEPKCPQDIAIIDSLARVHAELGREKEVS